MMVAVDRVFKLCLSREEAEALLMILRRVHDAGETECFVCMIHDVLADEVYQ
jgi:hypothetical protein